MVNEAERILPAGKMLTNLTETMQAYKDARSMWGFKIETGAWVRDKEDREDLIARSGLRVIPSDGYGGERVGCDEAMQVIWTVGAAKLAKARSPLNR
jgi:hypothetical protein